MIFSPGDYAVLAKGAYKSSHVKGWDIDQELSGDNHTTYINKRTGKAVVAFSGTRLHNGKRRADDISADAAIMVGTHQHHHRFHAAIHAIKRAYHKYGHGNVEATGHSLGGSLAMHASHSIGVPAMVFNPGVSPYVNYNTNNYSNVIAYAHPNDPVSNSTSNISSSTGITTYNKESAFTTFGHVFSGKKVPMTFTRPRRSDDGIKGFWKTALPVIISDNAEILQQVKEHPGAVMFVATQLGLALITDGGSIAAQAATRAGYQAVAMSEDAAVLREAEQFQQFINKLKGAMGTISMGIETLTDYYHKYKSHVLDPSKYGDPLEGLVPGDPSLERHTLPNKPNPYAPITRIPDDIPQPTDPSSTVPHTKMGDSPDEILDQYNHLYPSTTAVPHTKMGDSPDEILDQYNHLYPSTDPTLHDPSGQGIPVIIPDPVIRPDRIGTRPSFTRHPNVPTVVPRVPLPSSSGDFPAPPVIQNNPWMSGARTGNGNGGVLTSSSGGYSSTYYAPQYDLTGGLTHTYSRQLLQNAQRHHKRKHRRHHRRDASVKA